MGEIFNNYELEDEKSNWKRYDNNHFINIDDGMIVTKETDLKNINPNNVRGYENVMDYQLCQTH